MRLLRVEILALPPFPQKKAERMGHGDALGPDSLADELIDDFAIGGDQREDQRHLAEGVGGTTEAGIEGADHGLDAIESALGELAVLYVGFGGL